MIPDDRPAPCVISRLRRRREPLVPLPLGLQAQPCLRRTATPRRRRRDLVTRYRLALVREDAAPYGYLATPPEEDPCVARPAVAARFLWRHVFLDEPREIVAVVFLNTKNRAYGHMVAFTGTLDRAVAEPRHILAAALLANAAGIVIAHNHPSGDLAPSTEDLLFVDRMQSACDALGIRLVDFLILGHPERWSSLLKKALW